LEKFDLSESVREVAESMAPQIEAARCQVKLELNPVIGRWDRFRIDLLVVNLLANAVRYAAGDEITVRVDGVDGTARVAVADKGPGIAPEQLPKLFERSASSAPSDGEAPSLGIGLYVAKEIVGAHGGTITAQSAPAAGATFTVELPSEAAALAIAS
jgi:signal transduction histidine kinase